MGGFEAGGAYSQSEGWTWGKEVLGKEIPGNRCLELRYFTFLVKKKKKKSESADV